MSFLGTVRAFSRGIRSYVRRRFNYIVVAVVAGLVGIGLTSGYATLVDYTNSLNFCAHTCHEMESTVFQEYRHSAHYKNEYGVVVKCSQCHVPHDAWALTLGRKTVASFELYTHFVVFTGEGPDGVKKAFEARRLQLARRVWAGFAETNARECKACHKYSNMILSEQRPSIRAQHVDAMKIDENCLDCHKGITHHVPVDPNAKPAPASNSFDIQ
ncbi:MAG: NapC/NirT family cytochrome c [Alphaproteobacteria bacterium]|nr:NapC/NirT family cytochrome c [Alphaproteobacteria bacterium]